MHANKTPSALRHHIERLPTRSPITSRFSAAWRSMPGGGQREQEAPWYRNQREHWLGWLDGYRGAGAYGRKNPNRSAQFIYAHVVNPQMLVYLAEASGVSRKAIGAGMKAALAKHHFTMAAMSAAFRREVPWAIVEAALVERG